MRKQIRIAKFLIDAKRGLLFPYMRLVGVDFEADELLTKTPMIEHRVIAVVAKRVDAIMLFRIV